MMGAELAGLTTDVPARFTALCHGGHEGLSFDDGTLGWSGPITLTTQNIETDEISTQGLPPAQCVLLAGTASVYDVRYRLKNQGAVAERTGAHYDAQQGRSQCIEAKISASGLTGQPSAVFEDSFPGGER